MLKKLLQPIILTLIALLIWFGGPLVAISGKVLLESDITRLFMILIITLCWGGYYFSLQLLQRLHYKYQLYIKSTSMRKLSRNSESNEIDLSYDENYMILNKHASEVKKIIKKQLKKIFITNFWKQLTYQTPLHLIIGNPHSGKSSMLLNSSMTHTTVPARSAIPLKLTQTNANHDILEYGNNYQEKSDSMNICYWHLIKTPSQAQHPIQLFIDTPGDFATSEINSHSTAPWKKLLDLVRRQKQKLPLSSIILTINIEELSTQTHQQFKLGLHLLKQRILDIRKQVRNPVPLFIILTKCDLIDGFSEFFDNLSSSERRETLAIQFKNRAPELSLTDSFKKDFDILLQHLNNLVINRLHQERNSTKRRAIKHFPIQLDQLKTRLCECVLHLAEKTNYSDASIPIGVYFTSSMQEGRSINILQSLLNTKLSSEANINESELAVNKQAQSQKTFFIQQLLLKVLQSSAETPANNEPVSPWKKYLLIGTSGIFLVIFIVLLARNFSTDLQSIYQLPLNFQDESTNIVEDTKQHFLTSYKRASSFWVFNMSRHLNFTVPKLIKTKQPQQNQAITWLSDLKEQLEKILQNPNASPDKLYTALKIYLMLAEPSKMDNDYLTAWFHTHNETTIHSNEELTALITHNFQTITPDNNIVQSARENLLSLPKQFLAYLILKNSLADLSESTSPLTLNLGENSFNIPFLYTSKGLQTLFLNTYKTAAMQALHGNWVLDKLQLNPSIKVSSLEKNLIDLYTKEYSNWWNSKYAQLVLPNINSISQANSTLQNLISPNANLVAFIQKLKANTDPNQILPPSVNHPQIIYIRQGLQTNLNPAFSKLNDINIVELSNTLKQINKFLNAIIKSNDINAASFTMAKQQFTHPSQQNIITSLSQYSQKLPQPFANWLNKISQTIWSEIIANAKIYINTQWKTKVLTAYQSQLKNHYPLYSSAIQDVNLTKFTEFFNPNGIINNFFQEYLSPFINQQQSQWKWLIINGNSLNFSDNVIQLFERSNIITNMFFPFNSDQINVHFKLEPIIMMPIVKKFTLHINGQTLSDQRESKNISSFIWPGNNNEWSTSLIFTTVNGQHIKNKKEGSWSWFHLLDQSHKQGKEDSRKFILTFDVNGTEVKYELTADNVINPFIPEIISQFRIPDTLS